MMHLRGVRTLPWNHHDVITNAPELLAYAVAVDIPLPFAFRACNEFHAQLFLNR